MIPIIDLLLQNHKDTETADKTCKPQVVILSPTRELTIQIFNEARKFSRGSDLITAVIYGGTSVQHQVEKIQVG